MPLQAGSRLGPYELAAPIGAGGMGEVWRGRDTRLDRSVAVKVLPDVEYYNPRDLASFSVAPAGVLVYRRMHLRSTQLAWVDRGGRELETVGEPSYYSGLNLGPNGQLLVSIRSDATGGSADVWVLDLRRPQTTRSTFVSAPSPIFAALSPDGSRLAVATSSVGGWAGSTLWIQPTSGGGSRQPLQEKGSFVVSDWSPDGGTLLGDVQEAGSGFDVAYVALKDPSRVVRLTNSRFDEHVACFSPDGRWVAYQSNETGRNEVFVTDFPSGNLKWQVSRSGGQAPSWRGDSREIYFYGPEGAVAVPVDERNGSIEPGTPARLPFSTGALRPDSRFFSPDGRRFLVERYASEDATEPIRLVRSWRKLVER